MVYYNARLDMIAYVWAYNPFRLIVNDEGNLHYVLTSEWELVGEM